VFSWPASIIEGVHPQTNPVFSTRVAGALKAGALAAVVLAAGTAAAQTPDHAPLPPGQVWQCVHDGHKIFSDAPCGSGATIRQLNDLNVMDPAPADRAPPHPSRVAYAAPYRDDAPPADYDATTAGPVYVTQQVIGVNAVQRAGRPARPRPHDHPFDRGHAARAPSAAAVAHTATSHAAAH
jgi:hypothetical protein